MSRPVMLAATALAGSLAVAGLAHAQPVTGLYIGAVGGGNFMEQEQVRAAPRIGLPPVYGKAGFDTGYAALGSVGWGFGNGVRVELEGSYRSNDFGRRQQGGLAVSGRERKYGPMVNALFDLDVGSPYVFPYIGAGAGYQFVDTRATLASGPYAAFVDGEKGSFAYQAIAGASFPIPPVVGLSLVAEYRWMQVVSDRDYGGRLVGPGIVVNDAVRAKADFNHSLMLGLRYEFNVAPPPVEAPAAVSPPPVQASRTYLVFFDWDRADLTPRGRQVVLEAAQATTRVQVTRIMVNGYTDTSGTPQYNQGLSQRRARAVADELVRDGVPRQAIAAQGLGETRLLVPTADGVREPQNRRVEIILQ